MTESIFWFPRLQTGVAAAPASHVERLVSVSWLMMTELFAYLEDVEGAGNDAQVQRALAIRMAELAFDLDTRLRGDLPVDEIHQLPMLLELGLSDLAHLDGGLVARALVLADDEDADAAASGARLKATYGALIAHFPGQLFNTLLPESQGQTLRTLRSWNKLCKATGTDAGFLAPLMRSL